jgi:hypothetical protein
MFGVTDPTDMKTADVKYSNDGVLLKMVVGQFATGTKDSKLKVYLNFLGGKYNDSAKMMHEDIVLAYAAAGKFSLGYNGTIQSRSFKVDDKWSSFNAWWGSAIYLNYDPVSWFGLTLRTEYFNDKKDVLGLGTSFITPTISGNFRIDNLTIIPEFRFDNADAEVFTNSSDDPTKSTGSFILAATYHF